MRTLMITLLALMALFAMGTAEAEGGEECTEEDGSESGCVPACPTSLHGVALQDVPGIFMSWQLNSFTDVNVYRDDDQDGEFELLERLEFPATKYIDDDTEPGVTYSYQVTAISESGVESEACDTLTVTAIPELGSLAAMSAAAALGVLGYAWSRRS